MKKKFESPEMRVVMINNSDVICTSCTTDASGTLCPTDDSCLRDR